MTSFASATVTPSSPQELVHREAHDHGAGVADRVLRVLDQLAEESRAILQRAAVLVGAMVPPPLEEVHRQAQVVRSVHVHEVEPRALAAHRRLAMPAPVLADVVLRHRARLVRMRAPERLVRGRDRAPRANRGSRRRGRCARARARPARHAHARGRTSARGQGCRHRPRAAPPRTARGRHSGGSRTPRWRPPPTRPRPSPRASRRARPASGAPCRCSGAPGRTGCARSPVRSGPARRGCRTAGRAPSAGAGESGRHASASVMLCLEHPHRLVHLRLA